MPTLLGDESHDTPKSSVANRTGRTDFMSNVEVYHGVERAARNGVDTTGSLEVFGEDFISARMGRINTRYLQLINVILGFEESRSGDFPIAFDGLNLIPFPFQFLDFGFVVRLWRHKSEMIHDQIQLFFNSVQAVVGWGFG